MCPNQIGGQFRDFANQLSQRLDRPGTMVGKVCDKQKLARGYIFQPPWLKLTPG